MKLTKCRLKQIIKEELQKIVRETADFDEDACIAKCKRLFPGSWRKHERNQCIQMCKSGTELEEEMQEALLTEKPVPTDLIKELKKCFGGKIPTMCMMHIAAAFAAGGAPAVLKLDCVQGHIKCVKSAVQMWRSY